MKSRVKAIIEVEVPEWQIGKEVSIYFPDTMNIKGVIKKADELLYMEGGDEVNDS